MPLVSFRLLPLRPLFPNAIMGRVTRNGGKREVIRRKGGTVNVWQVLKDTQYSRQSAKPQQILLDRWYHIVESEKNSPRSSRRCVSYGVKVNEPVGK